MGLNDAIIARISAKGQSLSLPLGVQVLNFSYEDTEKEDDMLNVVFADPYNTLIDSESFTEGTEWQVQWGFPNNLFPARTVLVKRPKYRRGEVELEALDKGSKLKVEERWDTYKQTTMSKIIGDIADRHQLKPQVEDANTKLDSFVFGGRTDYDVLKYFEARSEDHVFKVQDNTLFFTKRRMNEAPQATFEYAPGRDSRLLSFEISVKEQDNAKSANQTTGINVDPFELKPQVFKADEGSTPTSNLGQRRVTDKFNTSFGSKIGNSITSGGKVGSSDQGSSTGKAIIIPTGSLDELKSASKGKRRKGLLDSVEAMFEIMASPNDPFLRSGSLIEIQGIGKKFSGSYRIVKITHDINNGYIYKIEARRNAVGSTGSLTSKLNGPLNNKAALPKLPQTVSTNILGSKSGSTYGLGGRLIG